MIKYAKIEGFRNMGEVLTFSHIYQFIEDKPDMPATILIKGYDGPCKVFKGYLFNTRKHYIRQQLLDSEREVIERYIGPVTECTIQEVLQDTVFGYTYEDYKEVKI